MNRTKWRRNNGSARRSECEEKEQTSNVREWGQIGRCLKQSSWRNSERFTKQIVISHTIMVESSEDEENNMYEIFKLKKLSFVSLFLLCLFEPFFCVDILLLFDFVDRQLKVVKNDEAFEFIQCFLLPCVSWICSLQVVCILQCLVGGRFPRFLPRVMIALRVRVRMRVWLRATNIRYT